MVSAVTAKVMHLWCVIYSHVFQKVLVHTFRTSSHVSCLWEQGINPRILFLRTYTDRRLVKMSVHMFICCDVSVSGTEKEGEGEGVRGVLQSPCVKVFGAYSMFWMCVYFRRTSHSFTQSSVGVALCLTSSLAPPTAVLLQPSESPISQLLKIMCVWCPGGAMGAWSPAVVLRLWSHVNSFLFRPLRSNSVCFFSFIVFFFCIPLLFFLPLCRVETMNKESVHVHPCIPKLLRNTLLQIMWCISTHWSSCPSQYCPEL